ncbi:MFS transporter [Streptomyces sp. NBC_01361]|uniref:MFS transporter n=1 Tax=Streptomyces sp. NBC_01361 TaxID=2903838 RepID=UPI002E370EB4|nr:MFS transporter [Streptomyces sp. NBC_01361]
MSSALKRPRPWYTATLGGMASYLDGATIVTVGVASVVLQKEFDLSPWALGALNSVLMLTFATGAIVGGRLGDLLGRRAVYSVDLLVYAAGVLTVILAPNQAVLFAGIAVTGLAMGADVPTSLALMAEEATEGKQSGTVAYAQTLWLGGVGIVQILAFFVGDLGALAAKIMFGHLLVVAVVVWCMRRGIAESAAWQRSLRTEGVRRGVKAVFRRPHGMALLATGLFFVISGIMPNTIGRPRPTRGSAGCANDPPGPGQVVLPRSCRRCAPHRPADRPARTAGPVPGNDAGQHRRCGPRHHHGVGAQEPGEPGPRHLSGRRRRAALRRVGTLPSWP